MDTQGPDTNKSVILIADDNELNLKVLSNILRYAGYAIRSAIDSPGTLQSIEGIRVLQNFKRRKKMITQQSG